jgi:hypothetical protein
LIEKHGTIGLQNLNVKALLKKIQVVGKGLWIYDWTNDELKQSYKELRPEGLFFRWGRNSGLRRMRLWGAVEEYIG